MSTGDFVQNKRIIIKQAAARQSSSNSKLFLSFLVDFRTFFDEFPALFLHSISYRFFAADTPATGELAHIPGNLHGAELGAAHTAEVGKFRTFRRHGFIMEFSRGIRIEG